MGVIAIHHKVTFHTRFHSFESFLFKLQVKNHTLERYSGGRWHMCAGYTSALHWVELCCAGVLGANVLQHALRLLRCRRAPLALSPRQQRLLGVSGAAAPPPRPSRPPPAASAPAPLSPARVWRVADASPPPSPPSPASPSSPSTRRADEFIADRRSLANYLRYSSNLPNILLLFKKTANLEPELAKSDTESDLNLTVEIRSYLPNLYYSRVRLGSAKSFISIRRRPNSRSYRSTLAVL